MGGRVHVEIGFGSEPVVGDFAGDGGDEAEERVGVGKKCGDAGSAADLFVESMLKKSPLASQEAEPEAGESQMNEGGGVGEQTFVVFDEASASGQPGKAAFDDPAARLDGKSLGGLGAAHDLQMQFAVRTQLFDPGNELARVTRVGPDFGEATKTEFGPAQQRFGTVAILHAGGRDFHAEQPTERVGQEVPFASFDLLVGGVAARAALAGGLDALAVEERRGRGFFFPALGRAWSRNRSPIHSHKPSLVQRRKYPYTVSHGGRSCGSSRHAQPVRSTYKMPLNTSRRANFAGAPPVFGGGISGPMIFHCGSLTSLG